MRAAISRRLMDLLSLSSILTLSRDTPLSTLFLLDIFCWAIMSSYHPKIFIVLEIFCWGLHCNLWAIESVIGFQPTVNATIRQPFFTLFLPNWKCFYKLINRASIQILVFIIQIQVQFKSVVGSILLKCWPWRIFR